MADLPKDTPKRAAYKAPEVCEIAHIQPYVLRSWESEFPRLGVLRAGARIYRPADLEQVLRIKRLVFDEGLTLAGARRRLEEEDGPAEALPADEFVTPEMRQRIGHVKDGLRQLLAILGRAQPADGAPAAADDRETASGQRGARAGGGGQAAAPPANGRASHAKTVQQQKAARAVRAKAGRPTRASERPRRRA